MESAPRAVLIVPCYNEAARLDEAAFVAFARARPDIRLLLVNDGSRDGTIGVFERIRSAVNDSGGGAVDVLDLPTNGGKAEAIRQGMLRALDSGAPLVGFWDADLATPLAELPAFIELLETRPALDMVFGSRVRLLGRVIERDPFRHYTGRVFATAASMTLLLPVYDTQCGAKLFRASPRLRSVFAERFLSRWIFDVEIVARFGSIAPLRPAAELEGAIYERPLLEWRDISGSKRRFGDVVRAAFDLARIRRAHREWRRESRRHADAERQSSSGVSRRR